MTNQNKGTINILFVCYGNISRGIPIGLNIWTEKCKSHTKMMIDR